jgi:hypothetical protein
MEAQIYREIQEIEQDHWWYVARRRIIFDLVLRHAKASTDHAFSTSEPGSTSHT